MTALADLQFSHVGLFVRDLDRMASFYCDVMGFVVTDRGRLNEVELVFLSRDVREHHQIVLVSGRSEQTTERVVNQISFRVQSLATLKLLHARLLTAPVTDIAPVTHGISWSIYFRDPDGNRIETFADSDWYIQQPCRIPLDLARSVAEIYAETKAFCESQSGWVPLKTWQSRFAHRLETSLSQQPSAS